MHTQARFYRQQQQTRAVWLPAWGYASNWGKYILYDITLIQEIICITMLLLLYGLCLQEQTHIKWPKTWINKDAENTMTATTTGTHILRSGTTFHCWPMRQFHCWGAGGGSGAHLGEGAVVTTTVETDFGEPVAMCCWSCCAGTVWIRTFRRKEEKKKAGAVKLAERSSVALVHFTQKEGVHKPA